MTYGVWANTQASCGEGVVRMTETWENKGKGTYDRYF